MPNFRLGDRVEIVGEIACQFQSKIGVISAEEEAIVHRKFTVRLADGTESVFWDFQLQIPPVVYADMIFDTLVSPVLSRLRGSTSVRDMRFISGEFDIHLSLETSQQYKSLLGQLSVNEVAPQPSLVTLLFKGKPHATTTTDTFGEFRLDGVPSGNIMLEILVPSSRIVALFEVEP